MEPLRQEIADVQRREAGEPDLPPGGDYEILRAETPSERACSVLECGLLWWPSRIRKLVFTSDPSAPVLGADETL